MIALERVGLAAGAVEREHQLAAKPLPERKPVDERLELGHEVSGASELEVGVDAALQGIEPQLLEAADLVLGEGLEGEVGEGRSSPERQRVAQQLHPFFGSRLTRVRAQALEARQVEAARIDLQHVPGRSRLDRIRAEQLAELGDEILEGRRRRLRRRLAPQIRDEALARDDLARVDEQEREQPALLLAAERDGTTLAHDLERPEDPELDHGFL